MEEENKYIGGEIKFLILKISYEEGNCCIADRYIRRQTVGMSWEDKVNRVTVNMMKELVSKVKTQDPVRGCWHGYKCEKRVVWYDASIIAFVVVLEI